MSTTTATELPYHYLSIPDNNLLTQKSILNLLNTKSTTSLHHLNQTHALILKTHHFHDHYISGTLIKSYSNPSFNTLGSALQVFDQIPNPNVFVWNAVIRACLDNNEPRLVLSLYFKMLFSDSKTNKFTYTSLFKACALAKAVGEGFQIHGHVVKHGFMEDRYLKSAGIQMYVSFGCLSEARAILDHSDEGVLDAVCFSAMIDGYMRFGDVEAAKALFGSMTNKSVGSFNVMINGFAKYGMVEAAREVFDEMPERDEISWNTMIGGLAIYGRAEEAIELFRRMEGEKVKPDEITFVRILNACAHGGLVDEGLRIFHMMEETAGVKPMAEHYGCVVDLLARARLFDEAEELIRTMPMKPSPAVWGAVLAGCRVHGNVDLGERVGKILLELEPENGGRYALLSNIYAKAGRWEEVGRLRELMKQRGVKTTAGKSVIDLAGKLHEFKVGDSSHPQTKEIYSMIEKIRERLESEGFVQKTEEVLFDIDEEEKETALWQHSEKLAVAFGLIGSSPGTPIRVMKSLRICEDCHSVSKMISKVYARDIIIRDRSRFHHFRNGKCSCNDFW